MTELACNTENTAARSVVSYLQEVHHRAVHSWKKAVTAELLARSISTARLVQGVSDEFISMIWWPRMAVELYEVSAMRLKL